MRFASPPIRHMGTMGGNVANGSPIGDSMPWMIALGSKVVLGSQHSPVAEVRRVVTDDRDVVQIDPPDQAVAPMAVPEILEQLAGRLLGQVIGACMPRGRARSACALRLAPDAAG